MLLLILALLALAGYFVFQQYMFNRDKKQADTLLRWADDAWKKGEIAPSAKAAREADAILHSAGNYHTPGSALNKVAGLTGLFANRPDPRQDSLDRARQHLERERSLAAFKDSLAPADTAAMAHLLLTAKENADPTLAAAMDRTVAEASLAQLRGEAQTVNPEEARKKAQSDQAALTPLFCHTVKERYENELASFTDDQRKRLAEEVKKEADSIAEAANQGNPQALERYRALAERLRETGLPELAGSPENLVEAGNRDSLAQLRRLADIVQEADHAARTVLSRPEEEEEFDVADFIKRAKAENAPNKIHSDAAVKMIETAQRTAEDLMTLRIEVFARLQSELRRNRDNPGTRMAWAMLRSAFDDPHFAIDPAGFEFDSKHARMAFTLNGLPATMEMREEDYEKNIRAKIAGFTFTSGWVLLYHKPLVWMAGLAKAMQGAGVDPKRLPEWELLEGPGAPLALSKHEAASLSALPAHSAPAALASLRADLPATPFAGQGRWVFYEGRLHPVKELPQNSSNSRRLVEDFRQAAKRLEEAVAGDAGISAPLRQAMKPVLAGTYETPDARDYFDSSFCRRLIEADYLETFIDPMPAQVAKRLGEYRAALGKLEAGYDEFVVDLAAGGKLYAVANPNAANESVGKGSDQDPETGETLPRFTWRVELQDETIFFSPQPARLVYAFMLAEHYRGSHSTRPAGVPRQTEIWHATKGRIASYRDGDAKAVGDAERWNEAIAEDSSGRLDPTIGPPGWNYPLHVLLRDDQGDPLKLATLNGVVKSPDFSGFISPEARRQAEDEWLDRTAEILSTPGELGLIFHQFFRYCSDSPLPELPNLIGSHYGLSDTHQTVYETLERRWVGRLIGDCDDLAEFFQVLTRRQGKLSHVMQLPGHAAAGYVEKSEKGEYRFVVLQTGPVLQFNSPDFNEVIEMAYRSFDRGEGISHMTADAVPLLLRFANEETRTPFVLSSRIFNDAEYADTMIQVQSYWHEHVYSSAIEVMEKMVEEDKEIGNIKELGSLYERVGFYEQSEKMRRRELEMVRDNPQAELSCLLEIAQLHFQDKNRAKTMEALTEMESVMRRMIQQDDAPEFFRAMTFRSFWAMYMARLGQPERAWSLVRYDVAMTKRQLGRVADPVLRTLVLIYDRLCMNRDQPGAYLYGEAKKALDDVRKELEEAFGKGYFKPDDSYNGIIGRYFVLGRYAISDVGRKDGIARLLEDGPYPTKPKDQTSRGRGVEEEDWEWYRITPQLYLALGIEMMDKDEYPELYDPAGAKPLLEDVARAVSKGTGLGSDVGGGDDVVKSDLTLSFLNNDLAGFRRAMATVKAKDYSSLYDDAANTFGLYCGLVPLADFRAWADAYHEFFPGSQHYFKVVYRAIDKEHYDHALVMAEATARFFPDEKLLLKEAEFVRRIVPELKEHLKERANRPGEDKLLEHPAA